MMHLADAAATEAAGAALGRQLRAGDLVALEGELGAGKTSLVRGALEVLGLRGEAASPTFPIVIEYRPPEVRLPILHVDLYRIASADELDELGLEDARGDAVLLVEWPERMGPRLSSDALRLRLAVDGAGRRLTWVCPAAWERRWPPPR